jgi:cell wall-associated NlpC family hydrolase
VKAKYLLTGTDAEAYAAENNISEIIAKSQDQELYLYEAPSADSKIVATVLADQELTVLGSSEDELWAQVSLGEKTGYVPADSIVLDVKYEEAVSLEAENNDKAAETETEAETEPETESEEKESVETEKETEAETEATETEKTDVSVEEVNETVWAAYSVSIRAEASVDAEKLGVLIGSESITRTGICDNGWSRVDYNGTTAYIKSEYLTTTQPAVTETEKTAEPEEVKETVYATAGVNVRAKASADSDIIGTVIAGYSITRTSNKDGWSKVDYNGTTGYIKSDYLTTTKPQVSESTEKTSTSTQTSSIEEVNETVYATDGVNIRAKASADAQKLGSLAAGSSITRTGKLSNGWSRVEFSGTTGYIKSDYLTTEKPSVTTTTTSSSSSLGQQIADFAVQYVGYPYVYGGNSLTNGVDCSGFTQQVYLHFGYSIPRRASIQGTVGTSVAISDLQPGDLVFYGDSTGIGHVVIYIGNGQVVHASTPSKGIIISDLYYRTPMCARRII